MESKKQSKVLIISLIVSLVALLGIAVVLYTGNAGGLKGGKTNTSETGTAETTKSDVTEANEENEEKSAVPLDTLFFASDYQIEDGFGTPADNLDGLLNAATKDGKVITNTVFCGDYTNDSRLYDYQMSPDESIEEIKGIVSSDCAGVSADDLIFVQGNHDKLTDSITPTGLVEHDNYLVYVLNTEYGLPWKQGRNAESKDIVIAAADDMKACFDKLIKDGEKRPVFIAGHVPIHFTARTSSMHTTGDNMYSKYIFDVVNEAAGSLDIVYLVGHNHSKGWDCYMGGSSYFRKPGDTLLIPDAGTNTACTDSYTTETLNFTYMNAGYLGYYMTCGKGEYFDGTYEKCQVADETLTGTVCEITPDELVFSRYAVDGIHSIGYAGEGDPYKGGIDSELIGPEAYGKAVESPVRIPRRNA